MTNGNIAIIGPRASGKTTYLAALAYHQNHTVSTKKGKIYQVNPKNPEARQLKEQAEEILLTGREFKATRPDKTVYEYPYYMFSIDYKPNLLSKNKTISLTTRDYPGEVFNQLFQTSSLSNHFQEFITDCFTAKMGCVILLSGWELGEDIKYRNMFKNFLILMDKSNVDKNYKLAVVMSKCERGEIWTGRLEPEKDLFGIHLKETKKTLKEKFQANPQNLKFFALSTFGIMSTKPKDPRPNREDRVVGGKPGSIIRDRSNWQPYNLIEPLLWISNSYEATQEES
ncbi:MAG: hypothetical protein QNJ64_20790 [Crocosphaera sp.]|nr:hypothetical protein [Crocosphaera sp.]